MRAGVENGYMPVPLDPAWKVDASTRRKERSKAFSGRPSRSAKGCRRPARVASSTVPPETKRRTLSGVWRHRTVFVAGTIVAVYLAVLATIPGHGVIEILGRFSAVVLVSALVLALLQNVFQATRLWILLPGATRLPWWSVVRSFSWGQVVNNFVPARAGDVLKIALVRQLAHGATTVSPAADSPGAPTIASVAGSVLIADKVVDIGSLFLLAAVEAPAWLRHLSVGTRILPSRLVWVMVAAVALSSAYMFRRYASARVRRTVSDLFRGSSRLIRLRSVLPALACGTAAWMTEAAIMMLLSSSTGIHLTLSSALGVLVVLNIGIAIPISFANVGTFETAVAFGLIRLGNPLPESLSVATVHHLVQVGGTLMLGGGFWLFWRSGARDSVFRVLEIHKRRAFDYFDGLAGRYEKTAGRGPLRFLRDRERRAVLAFARFDDCTKRTMVDVGCGGGYYALAAKRAGLHVCAVDVAPKMIRLLEGKVDETHCGDIESLGLPSTYDIVVCSGVLDFVVNPGVTFENLAALTARGGRLIVQVPRRGAFGWIYRLEKKLLGIEINQFSREWFETQAQARGLVVGGCVHPLPTNSVLVFERPTEAGVFSPPNTPTTTSVPPGGADSMTCSGPAMGSVLESRGARPGP